MLFYFVASFATYHLSAVSFPFILIWAHTHISTTASPIILILYAVGCVSSAVLQADDQ